MPKAGAGLPGYNSLRSPHVGGSKLALQTVLKISSTHEGRSGLLREIAYWYGKKTHAEETLYGYFKSSCNELMRRLN